MSEEVRNLVHKHMPDFPASRCGRLFTDTTPFMDISYGDVIVLGGLHYLVLRDEQERRFGMEDPKFWVKRCHQLETGERKILKLVFYENFPMNIGGFKIQCYRSPHKEARILNLVKGDERFMQGISAKDAAGNVVRVLDVVLGKRLDSVVEELELDHRTYFHEVFPGILAKYLEAVEAIGFLHANWEKHGDIRRDHLWVEYGTGRYRWIDFDYTFEFQENPFGLDLFGLGNILLFLVGKGSVTLQNAADEAGIEAAARITPADLSLIIGNRVVNLGKLFSYLPEELNRVLLHFSAGAEVFYDSVDELMADLGPCLDLVGKP
ncbi:MAG: serine/threonine protein kinase [Desulfovibrionaceae bacterium]|nr:serine/threonine protein kinase [Desulfovibrionaceae bacterium]